MGYEADLSESTCVIRTPLRGQVTAALQRWATDNPFMYKWVSLWEDMDDIQILSCLGFDLDESDGGYHICYFSGKLFNLDEIIKPLAPFVEVGSYMQWHGEDLSVWRHVVVDTPHGHQVVTLEVQWPDADEHARREHPEWYTEIAPTSPTTTTNLT